MTDDDRLGAEINKEMVARAGRVEAVLRQSGLLHPTEAHWVVEMLANSIVQAVLDDHP